MVNLKILNSKKRVVGLDILRSVAILLVLHEHSLSLLPYQITKFLTLPSPSIDGVSIFFVLSGFLIGSILLRIIQKSEFTTKDIRNFWIQRWLRTLPNYYFIVIILIFLQFLLPDKKEITFNYFIFSQNLYHPHPSFFPEAWSLSVEEWFYLTFPIFIFIFYKIFRKKNKSVLIAAMIFLILPFVLRILKYYHSDNFDWDIDFRKIVILRMDSLMYGVIGAYISIFYQKFWKKVMGPGLILSLLIIVFLIVFSSLETINGSFSKVYHFNLESIAVLCALPFFAELKAIKNKHLSSIFTFLSLISYSMYLINLSLIREICIPSIFNFLGWEHTTNHRINLLLYFSKYFSFWLMTLFFSYCLYKYFEMPIMKFRDRLKFNKYPS